MFIFSSHLLFELEIHIANYLSISLVRCLHSNLAGSLLKFWGFLLSSMLRNGLFFIDFY